jgi:hypothetical protein
VPPLDADATAETREPERAAHAAASKDGGRSDGGSRHPSDGVTVVDNQKKINACCRALQAQARALGAKPEAKAFDGYEKACDALAKAVGPSATAPELNQMRGILKLANIPNSACGL